MKTSARIATPSSREQRQVDGAGDLRRGVRLPCNSLGGGGGESADAQTRADHDHPESQSRTEQVKLFHSGNLRFPSDAR